jgi:hypothetical protein
VLCLLALLAIAHAGVGPTASAQLLPPVLGGGGGGGGGGPTNSPVEPPAGGVVWEGESLHGMTVLGDGAARSGTFGRTTRASTPAAQPEGTYRLTTRIRAANGARVDLLADDAMTGSYWVGAGWTTVDAVLHLEPSSTIGVGSWVRSGAPGAFDVDWLHLVPVAQSFTARGNQLLDATGNAWRLRGINQGDYQDPRYTDAVYAPPLEGVQMHAWGANWVRVGLSQEKWHNNCRVIQQGRQTDYRSTVAAVVEDLTSRGILVLIALAGTDRGENPGCRDTNGVLFEMADTRSIPFWQAVAARFRTNPLVAFDLFNEPHDISDEVWRNGGRVVYGRTMTGQQKSFTAVGMQALYDAVRSTGATNLVFVSGQRWASDARVLLSMPLQGYGIVAAAHTYCHTCHWDRPALPHDIDMFASPELLGRHPFVLTEAGWHYDTAGFNRRVIDWAESRGVGWGIYAWLRPLADGWPDTYSIVNNRDPILDAGGGTMVRPPSMNGRPVWNSLAPTRTARGFDALPMPES